MINGEGLFANEEVPEMAAGIDIIIEKPLDETVLDQEKENMS